MQRPNRFACARLACAFAVLLLTLRSAAAPKPASFTPLGLFGGAAQESRANAASLDGSVVVGRLILNSGFYQPFRWTPTGGMTLLADLPGGADSGQAYGVSWDGKTVVGESVSTSNGEAAVWSGPGYAVSPLFPPAGSVVNSFAEGITPDGKTIIGSVASGGSFKAFRWTASGGLSFIGPASGFSTTTGVSSDGSVVVGYHDGGSIHRAYRWTALTGAVDLPDLPGGLDHAQARAVTASGAVTVGFATSSRAANGEAVMWDAGGAVHTLATNPGPFTSAANGVSADGWTIVGTESFSSTLSEAFIWDPVNGMRNLHTFLSSQGLNLTGWTLDSATGISADGSTVVGYGTDPFGKTQGWVAVLPEPTVATVVVAALFVTSARRVRARRVGV